MHLKHRYSHDLDLFSEKSFDIIFLENYVTGKYGYSADFSAPNTLKGSINEIKIDFIAHPYNLVSQIIIEEQFRIYSIQDIAAMKINAIAGSGTRSKDFVDLYFLLKIFTINDLLGFYEIKYKDKNLLHVIKSLNYFDDAGTSDWPEIVAEKNLTWNKVKSSINKSCNKFIKEI
jgi:predicted nucleotidyltransferase component of viral defense system